MNSFSHVYIENEIFDAPAVKQLLARLHEPKIIKIDHYKDIFCRKKQSFNRQKAAPALILATKKGELLYKGARVCQSFGNEHFYYTSCIMNCLYSCEYCYLGGMYPSGNIVVFLNTEDYFDEVRELLAKHPMYISISYDTDLLALNGLTGILNSWIDFADSVEASNPLTLEVRTKCGSLNSIINQLEQVKNRDRIIFAYTLSPDEIISRHEKGSSPLSIRLSAIKQLQSMNFPCRLCFDPLIYVPDFENVYSKFFDKVFEELSDVKNIFDASIGSFRISDSYLKNLRKDNPLSSIAQFPYVCEDGVYHYPQDLLEHIEGFALNAVSAHIAKEKIFLWK